MNTNVSNANVPITNVSNTNAANTNTSNQFVLSPLPEFGAFDSSTSNSNNYQCTVSPSNDNPSMHQQMLYNDSADYLPPNFQDQSAFPFDTMECDTDADVPPSFMQRRIRKNHN